MSKKRYGKLVRDRVPDIIRADNQVPNVRVMDTGEYRRELLYKLIEESEEVRQVADMEKEKFPAKLADVLEVVDAIIEEFGIDRAELEVLKAHRRETRGGLGGKIFLESVQ